MRHQGIAPGKHHRQRDSRRLRANIPLKPRPPGSWRSSSSTWCASSLASSP